MVIRRTVLSLASVALLIVSLTGTSNSATSATSATSASAAGPFAGAPECATHASRQFHGLWDAERGCHYDHTHNFDPNIVNDTLGAPGRWRLGRAISYAWQTPNENMHKHTGYKYAVNRDLACTDAPEWQEANCVRAFRIQYHYAGVLDLPVRFHSYFSEAQICARNAASSCGVIRTGGWADFGALRVPYNGARVPLSTDTDIPLDHLQEPYRTSNPHTDTAFFLDPARACRTCRGPATTDNITYWSTDEAQNSFFGANKIGGFKYWVFDDPALTDVEAPTETQTLCPQYDCRFNNSSHLVYEVVFNVSASLDTDGDGYVTYRGRTDRYGNIVHGCRRNAVDCVPLELEHVPVGLASWLIMGTSGTGYDSTSPGGIVGAPEFDISPAPEWWIRYPN